MREIVKRETIETSDAPTLFTPADVGGSEGGAGGRPCCLADKTQGKVALPSGGRFIDPRDTQGGMARVKLRVGFSLERATLESLTAHDKWS